MASPADRRTIDELITRYELEPSLRDIYVEGSTDKAVLDYLLPKVALAGFAVYEIDTVDISPEVVAFYRLDQSNRGRVVALALSLGAAAASAPHSATCIVDADFDRIMGINYHTPLLLLSDYSCLEMYAFNENTLSTFFGTIVRRGPPDMRTWISQLAIALQELFLIRLVNHAERLGLSHTQWYRCCRITPTEVSLDSTEYSRRHLNANNRANIATAFSTSMGTFRGRLDADPRHQINGHDFIQLLCLYVRSALKSKVGSDPEYVGRILFLCTDPADLSEEALFKELSARLQR